MYLNQASFPYSFSFFKKYLMDFDFLIYFFLKYQSHDFVRVIYFISNDDYHLCQFRDYNRIFILAIYL
jgi:hypothetical protein